jgi:hypothetical protein
VGGTGWGRRKNEQITTSNIQQGTYLYVRFWDNPTEKLPRADWLHGWQKLVSHHKAGLLF